MRVVFQRQSAPAPSVTPIFVTPMIDRMLDIATPDFLATLRAHVLSMEQRDRGRNVSNFGGWHSSDNFFDQQVDVVQKLGVEVLKIAAEMSYMQIRRNFPDCVADVAFFGGSWANISRNGDFNKPHNHPGPVWSGVFYVSLGQRDPEPVDNGWIEFLDPRASNPYGTKVRIDPKPGQVLLFPAWLHHYVNPFRGKGERISIAFNTTAEIHPAA
jgi:uncharacterized protein (TIGR02466 family)